MFILAYKKQDKSMIYNIILFFGFGIFALSDFGGTVALGILVSITLLAAMLSNLILLHRCYSRWTNTRQTRPSRIPRSLVKENKS